MVNKPLRCVVMMIMLLLITLVVMTSGCIDEISWKENINKFCEANGYDHVSGDMYNTKRSGNILFVKCCKPYDSIINETFVELGDPRLEKEECIWVRYRVYGD